MKFTRVIGSCDPKIVQAAEDKLSSVMTELSLGYDNKSLGTGLGGCPLTFQLVWPLPHYCDALSVQLDDMKKKEKDQEERIAKGEIIPDDEKIPDEAKEYRRQMKGKVLRTAATDGKRFYWSPTFVNKISKLGLRIVVHHEAWHAIFMHPQRRGSRHPQLFNIAVDYIVNGSILTDLKNRDIKDPAVMFAKELGEYITLEEYAAFLRDPFNPPPRLAHLNPTEGLRKMADPAYKDPYSDRAPMYYADHQLSDDMKRPENVYDYLMAQIPKCTVCGRLGKYKKPEEYKALQKKIEEQEKKKAEEKAAKDKAEGKTDPNAADNSGCCKDHKHSEEGEDCCEHDHSKDQGKQKGKSKKDGKGAQSGQGQPGQPGDQNDGESQPGDGNGQPGNEGDGSCCGGENGEESCDCPSCGGSGSGSDYEYVDPFGAGETLDDHISSDISQDELQKRMEDAVNMAKRMAGKVPAGLEDELGILGNPIIKWEDIVRQQMIKKRRGVGRSDWTTIKSRPMFAGLYVPKKKDFFLNIAAFVDCSGSMSVDDIAFGLEQLQVIDDRSEMSITPFDTICYWDKTIKIKKADIENLSKFRPTGRGGTMCGKIFEEYEEHCGKVDMLLVISDSFIADSELVGVKLPPKETSIMWIVTSHNPAFRPPVGKVCHLHGEKM